MGFRYTVKSITMNAELNCLHLKRLSEGKFLQWVLTFPWFPVHLFLFFCSLRLEQLAFFFSLGPAPGCLKHTICVLFSCLWLLGGNGVCASVAKHSNYTKLHQIQGMWERPNTDVTVNLQKTSDEIMQGGWWWVQEDMCERTH